ncbi:MAG TPA: ribonuclease III [Elusimicrobiales bacterium]|nr:ribonuclease III [Elusimicrobiales bacterium]
MTDLKPGTVQGPAGLRFRDAGLLRQALTHKSYSAEHKSAPDNERLEFLGDSVLGLAAAHYLYSRNPQLAESGLAKLKSRLVSRPLLAQWARDISLGRHLRLGQGEESTGGRERETNLANAMEALIGALYLDNGWDAASAFVEKRLESLPQALPESDFKSALQEQVQKACKTVPEYELLQSVGPEHDKIFTVQARLGKQVLGSGKGRTKKEAEQNAAKNALEKHRKQDADI